MRIHLNLATRPFADLGPAMKRLRLAMGALALVCIALGLGLHALHRKAEQARNRERSLDAQIARVTGERQGFLALMRKPDNALLLRQVDELNQLFDEKAFSWTLAMENLETVLPGRVQVTTLEPVRAKDGHITLHLRVAGPRDLGVDLVRNLEHSERFLEPRITGENSEATGNGANQHLEPVSASNRFDFDLLAEYNPPGPEEREVAKNEPAKDQTSQQNTDPGAPATVDSAPATLGNAPAGMRRLPRRTLSGARRPYTGDAPVAPANAKPNPAVPEAPQPDGAQPAPPGGRP
jgi:type IV pilus assembly protein PilN